MTKKVVLLALSGMMMLMGGLPAFAQIAYNFHMSSSFYAGNAKVPAGTYTLRQSSEDPSVFSLQNTSGSHSILLETRSSSKASKGNQRLSSIVMQEWIIWRPSKQTTVIQLT